MPSSSLVGLVPLRVRLAKPPVTTLLYRAVEPQESLLAALVLAPGAGAPQRHPFLVRYAKALSTHGVDVMTFDFPYAERGSRRPDSPTVLEETWLAVIRFARRKLPGRALFIGGKSMGGRIASQVASREEAGTLAGLVFLGYPLHPPGAPEKLRVEHLGRVRAPMLFVQGERDPFGTPKEIQRATSELAVKPSVHIVPDGDHSFGVRKSLGFSEEAGQDAAHAVILAFLGVKGRASM